MLPPHIPIARVRGGGGCGSKARPADESLRTEDILANVPPDQTASPAPEKPAAVSPIAAVPTSLQSPASSLLSQPANFIQTLDPLKSTSSGASIPELNSMATQALSQAMGLHAQTKPASKKDAGRAMKKAAATPKPTKEVPQRAQADALREVRLMKPSSWSMSSIVSSLGALDERLIEVLSDGSIRLLRVTWLRQQPPGFKLPMRQALEQLDDGDAALSPLLSPEEAVEAVRCGDRRVGVLSHGWCACGNPDPTGRRMQLVRRALDSCDYLVALFWGKQPPIDAMPPRRPCRDGVSDQRRVACVRRLRVAPPESAGWTA